MTNPTTDQQPPRQQAPDPHAAPGLSWRQRIRNRWQQTTGEDRWLGRRLQEVREANDVGWYDAAPWIRKALTTALAVAGLAAAGWALARLGHWLGTAPWQLPDGPRDTGLLATLHQPVRAYLATHTAGLPVTATTAYGAWQLIGLGSFALGWLRSTGARWIWILWGAATAVMVWSASPISGRPVALALALLAWTAASVLALRGLTLRTRTRRHYHSHTYVCPYHQN